MGIELQEIFEIEGKSPPQSMIKTLKQEISSHQIFIDEEIGEPSKYRELTSSLYMASENDEFNFLINSCGGNLSATMAIIEGIKSTEGTVRAIITGECHSAASILALHCHEIIVTDSAHCMIHTAQYGTGGNTHMVQKHADFSTKMINRILDETYSGFLTEEELKSIKCGVELWFDAEEIRERLTARQVYMQEQLATQEAIAAKKARKPRTTKVVKTE